VPRTTLSYGLKSECESLAAAVRAEIGLSTSEPLNPRALAAHLGIPVHPLSSLGGNDAAAAAIDYVRTGDPSVMSAMTIFPDWPRRHRIIIFNDANTPQRQNSDLAHELSHGLRLHEPRHAIVSGCRDYAKVEEDEAAWLSGCLLVPRNAALAAAMSSVPIERAAAEYGVSNQMMSWRINATGARAQAASCRAQRALARERRPAGPNVTRTHRAATCVFSGSAAPPAGNGLEVTVVPPAQAGAVDQFDAVLPRPGHSLSHPCPRGRLPQLGQHPRLGDQHRRHLACVVTAGWGEWRDCPRPPPGQMGRAAAC
jgi:hypothetical protein